MFLLLKVLKMLKTSKSGGAAAPLHPPALLKCTPKINGTFCEKTKMPCLESRKGCLVGGKYLTHGVSFIYLNIAACAHIMDVTVC